MGENYLAPYATVFMSKGSKPYRKTPGNVNKVKHYGATGLKGGETGGKEKHKYWDSPTKKHRKNEKNPSPRKGLEGKSPSFHGRCSKYTGFDL